MQKRLSLMMASVLAILIALGAVANTASAIESCMPKACCCSKAGVHGAASKALANATADCQGNSPCCQVQPSVPFPDMALITSAEAPQPKMAALASLSDNPAPFTQQTNFTIFYHKAGNLKIPTPPLYLQNQSFLC